ncbi:MAG: zinc-ribbon domain-containing protein [Deltaproteobacteria bacterium]|nr:zinc-ribbon domain-containing protein [Deltaproteobacteria bacterium]
MELVCESCKAKLNIPEEKLPPGQRVSVRCPRCKNKLVIDTKTVASEGASPPAQVSRKAEGPTADTAVPSVEQEYDSSTSEIYGLDDTEADSALDSYEEGDKLALLMTADDLRLETMKAALDALGYNTIRAENTREAVSKMRFLNFDLVILSDLFDNIRLQQSPILQYLNHLSMSVRRKMFVVLMSDTFRTMDPMSAFAMSANLVANWKDLGRFSNILARAVSENANFYKVFMDTLRETGKA